ncbi:hypothetical protein GCM10012275_40930 [Longimycelium tulufanense]|uniref:Uncharacterized protein n=1 Tax=Longimycelium tulufanense TaxID=907463 RepID=A0A8J3FXV5_9PSEU|nr:hypothetical protein [Longimycelium tulufanense]GGM66184.1 hypothetical protein GCM10012275_40930 [Longimycelium tulufanense]
MNAESVTNWLTSAGVPPEVVSIGAEADDAWCLLRDEQPGPDGQLGWEVFWREQGNRYDWARFDNEQVACFYLFGRLAWTQLVRGHLTPTTPAERPEPAAGGAPAQ